MAVNYGQAARRVTSSEVYQVVTTGGTVLSTGDDNDGFFVSFQHDQAGCGAAESGVFVEIKDFITWTYVSMEFYLTGTAACWSFNNGDRATGIGNSGTGNLLSFNSTLDRVHKSVNCFELPQFTLQMSACDNNSNNFFNNAYHVGSFKTFRINRRRNVNGNRAGPMHGRSCNTTGSGSVTLIRNIWVW